MGGASQECRAGHSDPARRAGPRVVNGAVRPRGHGATHCRTKLCRSRPSSWAEQKWQTAGNSLEPARAPGHRSWGDQTLLFWGAFPGDFSWPAGRPPEETTTRGRAPCQTKIANRSQLYRPSLGPREWTRDCPTGWPAIRGGTRPPKWPFAARSIAGACDTGWTPRSLVWLAGGQTSCSRGPRWRFSWTAASGTAARSTGPSPRTTAPGGTPNSQATRPGTGTPAPGCRQRAGPFSGSGNTKTSSKRQMPSRKRCVPAPRATTAQLEPVEPVTRGGTPGTCQDLGPDSSATDLRLDPVAHPWSRQGVMSTAAVRVLGNPPKH